MPAERTSELVGDGVVLVPVRPGAAATLLAGDLGGRPAGRGWPHDDTVHALALAEAGGLTWLVVDADGAVVGELGTKSPPSADGEVEIGYGLAGPSRGRGLGTRAVAALLDWLRDQPDVRTVIAHVDPANMPSARLLLRLGFTPIGQAGGEDVYRLSVVPPW